MAWSSCGEPLRRWPIVSVSVASRRQANASFVASPMSRSAGARYASSHGGRSVGDRAVAADRQQKQQGD